MPFRPKAPSGFALLVSTAANPTLARRKSNFLGLLPVSDFSTSIPSRTANELGHGNGLPETRDRCFSYITGGETKIDPVELNPWLKQLDVSSKAPQRPLVAFATPQQRHLLESGPGGIIRTLVQRACESNPPTQRQISVITGVVDRINYSSSGHDGALESPARSKSSHLDTIQNEPERTRSNVGASLAGAEGVAVSSSWDEVICTPETTRSRGIHAGHIRFSMRTLGGIPHDIEEYEPHGLLEPGETRSVTLSLAPTMMQTGTDFFLRKQTWAWDQEGSTPILVADEDIERAELVQTSMQRTKTPSFWQPAPVMFPITQPRRVNSSFGNVIQTFDFHSPGVGSDSMAKPASHELEQRIGEFRKGLQGEGKGAEIWATVRPGNAISNLPRTATSYFDVVENIVQQGLSLFHVHGGGGGWEGRGGPVTLDPGDITQQATSSQEALSDEAALKRYLSGADSLVKPGDVVQFFLVGLRKTWSGFSAPMTGTDGRNWHPDMQMMAGTLPCAADRGYPTESESKGFPSFGVLAERATFSVEVHAAKAGYDHGARKLGCVYKTNLPPSTSCVLAP